MRCADIGPVKHDTPGIIIHAVLTILDHGASLMPTTWASVEVWHGLLFRLQNLCSVEELARILRTCMFLPH